MTKKFPALALVLLLGACAQAYDRTALAGASLTLEKNIFACEAKQEVRLVKNFSEYTACRVAAERNFATAIHLHGMDAFETYATQMLALAADRDAGRVELKQIQSRAASIRKDYWAACSCNITGRQIARSHGGDFGNYDGTNSGGGPFVNYGMGSSSVPYGH
jgi:hypothetical protein